MKYLLFLMIFSCHFISRPQESILVYGRAFDDKLFKNQEQTIVKELCTINLNAYKAIFIFSTAYNQLTNEDVSKIVDFIEKGGAVYVGNDNEPFNAEGNYILSQLFQLQDYGNFQQSSKLDEKDLGKSTSSFPLDYRFEVLLWKDDNPLIMKTKIGKGVLIIDGGYARFYETNENVKLSKFILDEMQIISSSSN